MLSCGSRIPARCDGNGLLTKLTDGYGAVQTEERRFDSVDFDKPGRGAFALKQISTGIPGLDALLQGGLPAGHVYLVRGEPGTGKTTLAMHFLAEGSRNNERGFYISLSQTDTELREAAEAFGFEIDGVEIDDAAALFALDRRPEQTVLSTRDVDTDKVVNHVRERLEREKPDRVVLDSLVDLQLLCVDPLAYRRLFRELKDLFVRSGSTMLIIDSDAPNGGDRHVLALVHGVISLRRELPGYGIAQRRIEINKIRGLGHAEGLHDFSITPSGVRVYPRLSIARNASEPSLGLVSTGIESLDELLGGGLELGTACFVMGRAGSGKSTLASAFLNAALAVGERAAAFLFEEHPKTFIGRADAVGLELRGGKESGDLSITGVEAGEVLPGEFVHRVLEIVDKLDPRVVVIDSVSGYLSASAEKQYRVAQINALLALLRLRDIITVMVVEQAGLLSDDVEQPVLSVLSDTVIVLRQYEFMSDIRRSIAVLKKRAGPHLTESREFVIEEGALQIKPIDESVREGLRHTHLLGGKTTI